MDDNLSQRPGYSLLALCSCDQPSHEQLREVSSVRIQVKVRNGQGPSDAGIEDQANLFINKWEMSFMQREELTTQEQAEHSPRHSLFPYLHD